MSDYAKLWYLSDYGCSVSFSSPRTLFSEVVAICESAFLFMLKIKAAIISPKIKVGIRSKKTFEPLSILLL